MFTDLPEAALREHRSSQTEPADFDRFWADTLAETRSHDLDVRVEQVETGLETLDVWDVTFAGWAGQPVRGWLRVPAGRTGPLPAVVQFVGYGGGRGAAVENLFWASAGFAHLQMDTRGQGVGLEPRRHRRPRRLRPRPPRRHDPRHRQRRDLLLPPRVRRRRARRRGRALARLVDADRVSVVGGSQGGGIALAVAALVPGLAAVAAYVPFLCDFRRATVITDADPYKEIGRYLAVHRDRASAVHEVLSYFDGVNFARRATAPAVFTTALMDPTCPPSTVFGAFHEYAGPAEITVWPYNGHEGGGVEDDLLALAAFRAATA